MRPQVVAPTHENVTNFGKFRSLKLVVAVLVQLHEGLVVPVRLVTGPQPGTFGQPR